MKKSERAGDSGAEERFAQLFCEAFGEEKGQFVYLQHPFVDIYGNHRTIDFAVMTEDGKVAFEIDGETWHNPGKVSQDKYADDLLKQNSMVFQGWRVFRWTDTQLTKTPDRVKDELITFLGYSPVLTYFDGDTPAQQGSVFELREHQEEALASLIKMREEARLLLLCRAQPAPESLLLVFLMPNRSESVYCSLRTLKSLLNKEPPTSSTCGLMLQSEDSMRVSTTRIPMSYAEASRASSAISISSSRTIFLTLSSMNAIMHRLRVTRRFCHTSAQSLRSDLQLHRNALTVQTCWRYSRRLLISWILRTRLRRVFFVRCVASVSRRILICLMYGLTDSSIMRSILNRPL